MKMINPLLEFDLGHAPKSTKMTDLERYQTFLSSLRSEQAPEMGVAWRVSVDIETCNGGQAGLWRVILV